MRQQWIPTGYGRGLPKVNVRSRRHRWPLETAAVGSVMVVLASFRHANGMARHFCLKSRCRNFFASQIHELYHVRYLLFYFLLFKQFFYHSIYLMKYLKSTKQMDVIELVCVAGFATKSAQPTQRSENPLPGLQ
jgi:hypothetical protein